MSGGELDNHLHHASAVTDGYPFLFSTFPFGSTAAWISYCRGVLCYECYYHSRPEHRLVIASSSNQHYVSYILTRIYLFPIIQGMSKSFGFAQFATLGDAQAFLEPSYPFVTLPPPSYVPPGGYDPEDDRTRRVKIDYSQSAQPHTGDPSRPPRLGNGPRHDANDGTRDIGSAHVPVLLLRGLDSTSTPDMIGEALRMSEGPGKKSAKGMKRIILIRDRASKISLGLSFVEFVDVKVSYTVQALDAFLNRFRLRFVGCIGCSSQHDVPTSLP